MEWNLNLQVNSSEITLGVVISNGIRILSLSCLAFAMLTILRQGWSIPGLCPHGFMSIFGAKMLRDI